MRVIIAARRVEFGLRAIDSGLRHLHKGERGFQFFLSFIAFAARVTHRLGGFGEWRFSGSRVCKVEVECRHQAQAKNRSISHFPLLELRHSVRQTNQSAHNDA